jgi:hypothetical protein
MNILFVFVAQVCIGTLADGTKVDDRMISLLVPYLARGLT